MPRPPVVSAFPVPFFSGSAAKGQVASFWGAWTELTSPVLSDAPCAIKQCLQARCSESQDVENEGAAQACTAQATSAGLGEVATLWMASL